jgi:hypothetical protein
MVKTSFAEDEPNPDHDGWLGHFSRGPAVFSVFRTGPNNGGHPHLAPEYRIECNDGAGPREICRFLDDSESDPEWFGAWRGDLWCPWILKETKKLISDSRA